MQVSLGLARVRGYCGFASAIVINLDQFRARLEPDPIDERLRQIKSVERALA